MGVDPQVSAVLESLAEAPDIFGMSPPEARAAMEAVPAVGAPAEMASVEDRSVPGPGGDVAVRVYVPPAAESPSPVLCWMHGGGWIMGSLDTADITARSITARVGCTTVSVGYRLAPEHPFPAAVEDCHAVVAWVVAHAEEIGADAGRVAVGGDSTGGNLAAVTALVARDRGGPDLCFQLLVYPVTDFDFATASMLDNAEGWFLTRDAVRSFADHYVDRSDRANPYAAPLRASDLGGLPPALVITADLDPLRDEGEAYGWRLKEAGVPTAVSRYDGMIHGFYSMTAALDRATDAQDQAAAALRAAMELS